jgi:putative transposase
VLRSPEFCDLAPAQVWARLLDDGVYLCSISTMYRLLTVAGENRERRRQRTHPAKKKPELIATAPNQVWSWDIERHEALLNRAVVKGHRHRSVAADRLKLRAA